MQFRLLNGKDGFFKLKEEEWGWKHEHDALLPVMTDVEIAPESLPKVVRNYNL